MKPLLAHIYEPRRVTYPCYVQPKFNGVRALYQGGFFQSRDQLPWSPNILAHLAKQLQNLFDVSVVLDGELYVHGWTLPRINGAVAINRNEPNEDTVLVDYYIYDLVDHRRSFVDRFAQVSETLASHISVAGLGSPRASTTMEAKSAADADKFYAFVVDQGFEGIMYRIADCPYTIPKQTSTNLYVPPSRARALSDKDNRCWHLLKRKSWQDDEFLITGLIEGKDEGKREGMVGALVLRAANGAAFRCGTGFSEPEAVRWWENPTLVVGKKAKIRYLVLSDAGIPLTNSLIQIQ